MDVDINEYANLSHWVDEQLLFATNMEGQTVDVSPEMLANEMPALPIDGWQVELAAPDVDATAGDAAATLELVDSQAIVWRRDP